MIKIDFIDFPIEDMIHRLCYGEKIYRINMDNLAVVDLGEKSVNIMIRDEQKNPDKYAYFVVRKEDETPKEEKKMFICATTGFKCIFCCPGACVSRKVREIEEPDKASYMKDERCPGDFTLESAYYDGAYKK